MILAAPAAGGAGTYFDEAATYTTPLPAASAEMVTGDFNSDGYPDLGFVAPNGSAALWAVKQNDQAGGYAAGPPVRYFTGPYNGVITRAVSPDFDGNGVADLAWVGSGGYLFSTTGPNFTSPYPAKIGPRLEGIASGDFNSDGSIELTTIDTMGGLYLLKKEGTVYRRYQKLMQLSANPNTLLSADFNQDGLMDLAAANTGGHDQPGISVLLNDEFRPGTFKIGGPDLTGVMPHKLIAADFNADGFPDLAFNDAASTQVYVLFNDSAGLMWELSAPLDCGGAVGALAAGDLDGDGRPELICADADNQQVALFGYDEQSRAFEKAAETYAVGRAPSALFAADVNGDEKVDLVSVNSNENSISVLINHYEPVVDLSDMVEIMEVSTGKPYQTVPVDDTHIYIDRPYEIVEMSAGFAGGMLLQTANNDKWVRSSEHIQLRVYGEAVLLVCYDSRSRRLPTWLAEGGWTQTMEWIRSTDHRAGMMQVYMKEVSGSQQSPVDLWLGGNHDGGDTRARSNYYVVVQAKGVPLAMPPVDILEVSTKKPYKVAKFEDGGRVYVDRRYHLVDYSEEFEGAVIVQTANNDKWVRDSSHLTLKLNSEATVFACYDRRAWRLPAWLGDGSWKPTGLRLTSTDRRAGPMRVWMRQVDAGDVLVLGGNHEGGYTRARSNYLVIVKPGTVEIEEPDAPLVQVDGRRNFQLATAKRGERVYLDRRYRIRGISQGLQDGVLVMTANNDKRYRGSSYMQLQVREKSLVYVCFDKRKYCLPRWLSDGDWTLRTAESVWTDDRRAGPMEIYEMALTPGQSLTLGGNHQGGDNRARSNYFVVVKPLP
jgi:hypothetical protein